MAVAPNNNTPSTPNTPRSKFLPGDSVCANCGGHIRFMSAPGWPSSAVMWRHIDAVKAYDSVPCPPVKTYAEPDNDALVRALQDESRVRASHPAGGVTGYPISIKTMTDILAKTD